MAAKTTTASPSQAAAKKAAAKKATKAAPSSATASKTATGKKVSAKAAPSSATASKAATGKKVRAKAAPSNATASKAATGKKVSAKAAPSTATASKATAGKKVSAKAEPASATASKATGANKVNAKAEPAKKAAAKRSAPKRAAGAGTTGGTAPKRASRAKVQAPSTIFLPRAVASVDDDNPLMAHGGGGGGFGRCGGRMLSNRMEQQLCNRLGVAGVVHSHSPRHYEIRLDETKVAAYAPMIVLRGRGREGKGVVIEAIEDSKASILTKVIAFREQYGQEFYVTLVADDEVLDEVPLSAYDESCSSTNVHTLIARLAE